MTGFTSLSLAQLNEVIKKLPLLRESIDRFATRDLKKDGFYLFQESNRVFTSLESMLPKDVFVRVSDKFAVFGIAANYGVILEDGAYPKTPSDEKRKLFVSGLKELSDSLSSVYEEALSQRIELFSRMRIDPTRLDTGVRALQESIRQLHDLRRLLSSEAPEKVAYKLSDWQTRWVSGLKEAELHDLALQLSLTNVLLLGNDYSRVNSAINQRVKMLEARLDVVLEFPEQFYKRKDSSEKVMRPTSISNRAIKRADLLVWRASLDGGQTSVEGGTFDSDPLLSALDRDAAAYCVDNGWARAGRSDTLLILSSLGYDHAKKLKKTHPDWLVDYVIYELLGMAEDNGWLLEWSEQHDVFLCDVENLILREKPLPLYHGQALEKLLERGWMEEVSDRKYKVTLSGQSVFSQDVVIGKTIQVVAMEKTESKKVFVVHGHDEHLLREVEAFLRKLKLDPVILFEELNKGRTIIEKFEQESAPSAFAIVLLTPDDVGAPKAKDGADPKLRQRARQNVVFELGFFFGKFGRHRVVALVKDDVEQPSDIHGIVYVPASGDWKTKIAKEMKAAGVPVDMNDL